MRVLSRKDSTDSVGFSKKRLNLINFSHVSKPLTYLGAFDAGVDLGSGLALQLEGIFSKIPLKWVKKEHR